MIEWLYLPHYTIQPNPVKLIPDFFQFLFATCQLHVFAIESSSNSDSYSGGNNRDRLDPKEAEIEPEDEVPDFITYTR